MNNPSNRATTYFKWALLGWISFSFALRLYFLDNLRWTYDEGIHVLLAQMLAKGYKPYSELFVSYPPLYTLSMDWTWQLFGTVEALQILMTLYTMLGILAVGLIAWRLGGWWAGLGAPVFLSLEPEFFRGSRGVLTEVPALSVAALAIAFAALYLWAPPYNKGRGWLVASGVTLAVSLMLKILSLYVIGLVLMMIWARHMYLNDNKIAAPAWQKMVSDGLIWGLALIAPIVVFSLMFDLPALFDQAIRFRFATRGAYEGEVNNFLFGLSFLSKNWPVSLLGLIGLWYVLRKQFRLGWFVPAWFLLAIFYALIQVPLRDKHLPLLLAPVSIMAGLGLGWLIQLWREKQRRPGYVRLLSAVVTIMLVLAYGWQTGQTFAGYSTYHLQYISEEQQVLVNFIEQFTAPNDCLITDDPTLAFVTDRLVPPSLAEASSARLRSGYLTTDMLVDITTQADCQIVAPVARRFKRSAPDFVEWTKGKYLGLWLYDGSTEVLMTKPVTHSRPDQLIQAQFDDQVELVGFDLSNVSNVSDVSNVSYRPSAGAAHNPARQAYLSLYWRPRRPFEQDFTIFVHVRDDTNNTLINADHQPYNGLVPTTRWPVDVLIKETIRLQIPPEMPAGAYQLYVGLYHFDGTEFDRLPLMADTSGEHAVIIPGFVVP